MEKRNILITGSNGMLGKDVVSTLLLSNKYNIYGINRNIKSNFAIKQYACDLTNFNSLGEILNTIDPDIIINCAANVNVDFCEQNKNYAYKINAESTKILASYKPLKTKFIYISTDSVFDGERKGYREEDNPNPLNYYAFTKLEGEKIALKENPHSIIIRTNIYGFHNPVSSDSLVEWGLSNLKRENYISGFDDVYFNPVYTKQLAKVICKLIDIEFRGLINIGCKEKLSKYDFLVKLADVFNIHRGLIGRTSVDSVNFKAKRSKNTTLNTWKFNNMIDYEIKIDDGIKALYEDYMQVAFVRE